LPNPPKPADDLVARVAPSAQAFLLAAGVRVTDDGCRRLTDGVHYRFGARRLSWEDRLMSTKKLVFIWLGSMLMILASALIVERYFPSHARSDPPMAFKPGESTGCNDCS